MTLWFAKVKYQKRIEVVEWSFCQIVPQSDKMIWLSDNVLSAYVLTVTLGKGQGQMHFCRQKLRRPESFLTVSALYHFTYLWHGFPASNFMWPFRAGQGQSSEGQIKPEETCVSDCCTFLTKKVHKIQQCLWTTELTAVTAVTAISQYQISISLVRKTVYTGYYSTGRFSFGYKWF